MIPTGYCFRAECHVALGQFDSAIADFEKAVELAPDLVRLHPCSPPVLLPGLMLLMLLSLADLVPELLLLGPCPSAAPGLLLRHLVQADNRLCCGDSCMSSAT